jgi:hypothetical protein
LLLTKIPRNRSRVHADGHDLHTTSFELVELFFETP